MAKGSSQVLQFHRLTDTTSASKIIAGRLQTELSHNKKVLWLLSGGSNIDIEAAALQLIPLELQSRLTISLNDERYGSYGHKDSNLQQFQEALQSDTKATIIPVLQKDNLSLEATTNAFSVAINTAIESADVVISQLGMGSDGHIAGILPESPAIDATDAVTSYISEQFQRITITFETLRHIQATYVFAFGDDKRKQLKLLRDGSVSVSKQPAQFLKQLFEVYVYNDQLDTVTTDDKGEY